MRFTYSTRKGKRVARRPRPAPLMIINEAPVAKANGVELGALLAVDIRLRARRCDIITWSGPFSPPPPPRSPIALSLPPSC